MIVLSTDTSSKVATVALLKDNELLGEYVISNKKEHSVILMPMIEKLLADCNLNISDIDGYVVSKGPGSFTGLRIGMATIKGLALGSNKPYVSISSLNALAYSLSNFNGLICPIMDALRENVYVALYKSTNNKLETILEPTSMDIDKLMDYLKEKNEKIIFTGDAAIKHESFIKENFPNAVFAPTHLNIVRASSLAEIGLHMLQNKIYDEPNSAPEYLKKPQAQRELERRLKINECNS